MPALTTCGGFGQRPWLTRLPLAAQAFCPYFTETDCTPRGRSPQPGPNARRFGAGNTGETCHAEDLPDPACARPLGLGACGYSTGDRAVSGGLLGAGAGAGIGALTGGSAGTGALIGGAAGAAGGALTSGRDVNLGRPVWR